MDNKQTVKYVNKTATLDTRKPTPPQAPKPETKPFKLSK